MLLGYLRIPAPDTDGGIATTALARAGCRRVFADRVPQAQIRRPELDKALASLNEGDALVVWQLHHLDSSLPRLVRLLDRLLTAGIGVRSLSDGIDSNGPGGEAFKATIRALLDLERAVMVERTRAGSELARRRGVKPGRRPKMTDDQIDRARRLIDAGESPKDVARSMGVSTATLYRRIPAAMSNRMNLDLFSG